MVGSTKRLENNLKKSQSITPFKLPQEAIEEFFELVQTEYSKHGLAYDQSLAEEHATRFFLGFKSVIRKKTLIN